MPEPTIHELAVMAYLAQRRESAAITATEQRERGTVLTAKLALLGVRRTATSDQYTEAGVRLRLVPEYGLLGLSPLPYDKWSVCLVRDCETCKREVELPVNTLAELGGWLEASVVCDACENAGEAEPLDDLTRALIDARARELIADTLHDAVLRLLGTAGVWLAPPPENGG